MGWLITLAILAFLWFLPIGVSAIYNASGPRVRLIAGPVRILVFPQKKKIDNRKSEDKTKPTGEKKKKEKPEIAEKHEKTGGSITDFLPLVQMALDFLDGFRRKLRLKRLELKVILAGGDPCDLAINYGRAWAAVGNLFPLLERVFVIKKRDVEVECDFASNETKIFARLDLSITLGRILSLSVWHGIRILIKFIKIINTRKGGINNESKSS